MKHASNPRRGRGRNNGKRNQNSRNRSFESSGSDQKVRGTAQQVLDKYLAMARDASSAGDRIAAEGFFQHAEHYYRILHSEDAQGDGNKDRKRHDNRGNRHNESHAKPEQQPGSGEQPDVVEAAPTSPVESTEEPKAPVQEAQPEVVEEKAKEEKAKEEKPRRRGRPRKAAVEPAGDGEGPSESAA